MTLSNLSMRLKLVMGAGVLFAASMCAVIVGGIALMYDTAGKEAEARAQGMLGEYSQLVSGQIGSVVSMARAVGATIEGAVAQPSIDRDQLGRIMTAATASRPSLVGMTLAFEPNGLDGNDAGSVGHVYSDATGRFVPYFTNQAGAVVVEQLDMSPEAGTEGWYDLPIREDRDVLTPPYAYEVNGVSVLMTTVSVVVHKDGKPAGIVTADLALDTIAGMISQLRPFGVGNVMLISSDGQWVAHPDATLVGQKLDEQSTAGLLDVERLGKGLYEADAQGQQQFVITAPLTFEGVADQWTMVMQVPVATIFAHVDGTRNIAFAASAVMLLAVLALVWWGAGVLSRPIRQMTGVMNHLAEGDFAVKVPYSANGDEIGEMARAVEVFRENGLKVSQMTDEERAASQRRRAERTDMMVALQAAFGEVVDAAIAGDFSKRVHVQFADPELNSLAGSINNLVETVDRGLSETGEVLAALADTNLTKRMAGDYRGSFAKLKGDTNAVADKLTEVVTQLRSTSRTLKTATGEILSGANDLSERTTKQAATIEETSAAMEQLASTVAENARMAEDANGKAQSVSKSAAHSGVTMSEANQAMERITSSSAKISNIIGMIDDIAFQTNLLALNASVEAARAGDAGKGFAVVAVEVRRLAQSAAQASSEVKVLIEQSANEVKGGSKLVSSASEQLTAMLAAVNQNASLMQSIAKASRAQAAAIDEVSVAVRTMDEMTQHNAALVEQTNAAIEQTEAQASELDRVVDIFTIEATADAAPTRTAAPARGVPTQERGVPTQERGWPTQERGVVDKVRSAARSYLTQGNAAISKDWSEF